VKLTVREEERGRVLWAAFERFNEIHRGAVPAWLAAAYLKMTPQGVFQASERGWVAYFQHGRNRLYSRKDLVAYRWNTSRRFADHAPKPPHAAGGAMFAIDPDTPKKRADGRMAEEKKEGALVA